MARGRKRKYRDYDHYLEVKNEKVKKYYQEHAEEIKEKARAKYHENKDKDKGADTDGK